MAAPVSMLILSLVASSVVPTYRGSASEKAERSKGRRCLRELALDIDGDHRDEIAIIQKRGERLHAVVFDVALDEDEQPVFTSIMDVRAPAADAVVRFERKQMAGDRFPELLVIFEERSPDEVVQHVRVLGRTLEGLQVLMAQSFLLPRSTPASDVIALGDAQPRLEIVDDDDDGTTEVVWVGEPQILSLPDGPRPAELVIGVHRRVFRYRADEARYQQEGDAQLQEFLPPKLEWAVEANVQVPKIWGTAQAFWATDGDLDTSWNVTAPKKAPPAGQRPELTVSFRGNELVQLVRVVPGCARNVDAWDIHAQVRAFTLDMSNGARLSVDLDDLANAPPTLRAAGVFPLQGGFGSQVLLLLERSDAVRWARLTIDRVKRSDGPARLRVNEACISELSFH